MRNALNGTGIFYLKFKSVLILMFSRFQNSFSLNVFVATLGNS